MSETDAERLVKCQWCRKEISFEALVCPYCTRNVYHRAAEAVNQGWRQGQQVKLPGPASPVELHWVMVGVAILIGLGIAAALSL